MLGVLSLTNIFFIILDAFSTFALLAILGWTLYHTPILVAGLIARKSLRSTQPPPLNTPRISVIVPVKDEGARLTRCLEAIFSSDYPKDKLEVIVVDGSSDNSLEAITGELSKKYGAAIKYIREENPSGKPHALNTGLAHATGEIISVFDADNIPSPDAFRRAIARFNDSRVAAIQGVTEPLNSTDNMVTRITSKEEKIWFQILLLGRWRLKLFTPLTGSCQFIRASALSEVGGWGEDELAEDLELSLKLFKKGYRVEYAPDVVSLQEVPTTLRGLAVQRHRWYRGYMEALIRHFKDLAWKGVKGLDAIVLSGGPYLMVFSFIAISAWLLSTVIPHTNHFAAPVSLIAMLNILSLFTVSLALILGDRPMTPKNLAWIPFIYIYWFLLTGVATLAIVEMVTRRPRKWRRTPKHTTTTDQTIKVAAPVSQ
ncbi:MAG: glycosyltransferase [Pyrobaculum sp.]